jgi:hypothetical protein
MYQHGMMGWMVGFEWRKRHEVSALESYGRLHVQIIDAYRKSGKKIRRRIYWHRSSWAGRQMDDGISSDR